MRRRPVLQHRARGVQDQLAPARRGRFGRCWGNRQLGLAFGFDQFLDGGGQCVGLGRPEQRVGHFHAVGQPEGPDDSLKTAAVERRPVHHDRGVLAAVGVH